MNAGQNRKPSHHKQQSQYYALSSQVLTSRCCCHNSSKKEELRQVTLITALCVRKAEDTIPIGFPTNGLANRLADLSNLPSMLPVFPGCHLIVPETTTWSQPSSASGDHNRCRSCTFSDSSTRTEGIPTIYYSFVKGYYLLFRSYLRSISI